MKKRTANSALWMWRIARPFLLAYLLIVLGMMLLENRLVYPVPPPGRSNWRPAGLDYQDIDFQSADGTRLHGWFLPHPNPKRVILFCHGNGEDVASNGALAAFLRDNLQAAVFIFDYRGYGHSEGWPNEAGCVADARAARHRLARQTGVRSSDIILMGRSLGAGVAVQLAAEEHTPALILECAFPSMPDLAARQFPWLPVRWMMKNRYESIARIKEYTGPLFQSQGLDDQLIPRDLARQLFDAAPGAAKHWLEFRELHHNSAWPAHYYVQLDQFLDHHAPAPPRYTQSADDKMADP